MKEENNSDYNMKLWAHEHHYDKESNNYEFYINLYITETKMSILVSNEGYSDAQHIFLHSKPQGMMEALAKMFNNDEESYKEYFKIFMFEIVMQELIGTEWEDTLFNDIGIIFKDEVEEEEE